MVQNSIGVTMLAGSNCEISNVVLCIMKKLFFETPKSKLMFLGTILHRTGRQILLIVQNPLQIFSSGIH